MQNEQRSQPAGAPTAPDTEHARRDSDVVQAALRLHLKHFHAVEAAHAEAEQALTATNPAPPAAMERAAAHRARREAFGQRRGFLEQLAGFPASGLTALSAADMQSLQIPAGVGTAALRTPLPLTPELPGGSQGEAGLPELESSPETWTTAEAAGSVSEEGSTGSQVQEYTFPEDAPDYTAEVDWELPSTESWELVPVAGQQQEQQGDRTEATEVAEPGSSTGDPQTQDQDDDQGAPAAAPAGKSHLPESRPHFKDLVSGRAEVPESSPRVRRTWMGLRRKGQRK